MSAHLLADVGNVVSAVLLAAGLRQVYLQPRHAPALFLPGAVGLVISLQVGVDSAVGFPVAAFLGVTVCALVIATALRARRGRRYESAAAELDPRRVASVRGVGKNPQFVALGPGGRLAYIAASDSGTLAVVDLDARAVRTLIGVGRGALSAAAVPGGDLVLVSVVRGRGELKIVDTAAGRVTGQVAGVQDSREVAATADGSAMYVASFSDDQVVRLDPHTLAVAGQCDIAGRPASVAVSRDGTRLYVGALRSGEVVVLDADSMTVLATVPVGVRPRRLAADPRGRFVYAACADGNVAVIDAVDWRVLNHGRPASFEGGIAVSPEDGGLCYLIDPESDSLLVLEMPEIRLRGRIAFGEVHAIDVAAGGDGLVYVAGQSGTLEIVRP